MIDTRTFYEAVDIQQRFIRQLAEIDKEKIGELINLLTGFFLEDRGQIKFIYGIAEGRSALALYDFLQQSSRYENIMPLTLDDPIRRYIDPEKRNLIIAATGSGETKSVIRYLEDAFRLSVPVVLITSKVGSKAYEMVTGYDNGYVLVIPTLAEVDRRNLTTLGSEFELKLIVMLNSMIPELYHTGQAETGRYFAQIDHFALNASLLKNIDAGHLADWIDKLINRRGDYIVDGVGRSGFVAKAFGMRLTHLGRNVFMRDGPTTPAFFRGDAYIPLSGSGNTREIVEGVVKAKLRGADVFPILVNIDSRLSSLMDSWGYAKNIMYIPVSLEDIGYYWEREMSKIVATKSVQSRPSISEINTYVFTNAAIALSMDVLGVTEQYLRRIHV